MQTFRKIDWNQAWRDDYRGSMRGDDREFWNRRAPSFARHVQDDGADEYVESFLRILNPQPEWSVLDVGCGPGTLALPLAKRVGRVTALDFSSAMIEILRARKTSEGIGNLTEYLASWEDDWQAAGIERHDVAVASRSWGSGDLKEMISKLTQFAIRRVFVSYTVGDGPFDPRIQRAVGREPRSNPDYIYLYNLLHQMGIHANVEMIEQKTRAYVDEDEAVNSLRFMVDNATPAEEEALRRFVSAHLVPAGKLWRLDGMRAVEWAVIWWRVRQEP